MTGSGREALLDDREWSGDPSESQAVVGRPSRMSLSGQRPSRMSGSGQKAFLDVCEWSGGPLRSPEVVGSGNSLEALPDVRKWLVGPPG